MVKKWNIYWTALNPVSGHEQAGTRPCLVVSNDIVNEILPVITVLPLSSYKTGSRIYPTEAFIPKDLSSLPQDSVAMAHQIRTITKARIGKQCGLISDNTLKNNLNDVLRAYFEI